MSVRALLNAAAARIDPIDAEWLLAHALSQSRAWLFAHRDDPVPALIATTFDALVARREAGEPVAYLTGEQGFWSFVLRVTPETLIPRPETERLVEEALARLSSDTASLDRPMRIADLGTGSGAIALALAKECPQAQVVATDASAGALEVARGNAIRLGLRNVAFRLGDWCAPLAGERFDVIVSNPPYIAEGDPHLAQGDLRFEPSSALSSGRDGFDDLRILVETTPAHLVPGGWLLFEHGHDQGEGARALLSARGFVRVETVRDLEDRDRVTLGCWDGRPDA